MGWVVRLRIRSAVTGRKHRVCVNGISSTLAEVMSGIPQGSVLGPVQFVLYMYINDPPDVVKI